MNKSKLGLAILLTFIAIFIFGCDGFINESQAVTIDSEPAAFVVVENNGELTGVQAEKYMEEQLKNFPEFRELYYDIYGLYFNRDGGYSRLVISPDIITGSDGIRVAGRFITDGVTFELIIYRNVVEVPFDIMFTFLHEIGHLIENHYLNTTIQIEWDDLFGESRRKLRENIADEFLRDYSKLSWDEDFSDAYAEYKLEQIGYSGIVLKSITKERQELLERILEEIEYESVEVIFIG